jgi:hypothetical protein
MLATTTTRASARDTALFFDTLGSLSDRLAESVQKFVRRAEKAFDDAARSLCCASAWFMEDEDAE